MVADRIAAAIYGALLWPANFLLSQFVSQAPDLAAALGVADIESSTVLLALSLTCWTLLALIAWFCVRLWQNLARITASVVGTLSFRTSLALRSLKTQLVCRLRLLWPQPRAHTPTAIPMIEFDDLDLAVLRAAVARGPGFALSAPELAEQFSLRPAQVQRSLDKLSHNKMLDYVIGSTDGFDNYRLTDHGAAFVAMWQRQHYSTVH